MENSERAVVVIGNKHYDDSELLTSTLKDHSPSLVAQGGSKGADLIAKQWCESNSVGCLTFEVGKPCPATSLVLKGWEQGRGAGTARNNHMLKMMKLLYKEVVLLIFEYTEEYPDSPSKQAVDFAKSIGIKTEEYLS